MTASPGSTVSMTTGFFDVYIVNIVPPPPTGPSYAFLPFWNRFMVTRDATVPGPWDGTGPPGGFTFGETEDHLVFGDPGEQIRLCGMLLNEFDHIQVGTSQNDELLGTEGIDLLLGAQGNDILNSRSMGEVPPGRGDCLKGDEGNDELIGSDQDDILTGGRGADFFNCGPGNDTVTDFNPGEGDFAVPDCEVI